MKNLLLIVLVLIGSAWARSPYSPRGGRAYGQDQYTNAMITIDYEHHEIHEGAHFFICDTITLGSGDSVMFAMKTDAGPKEVHLAWDIFGSKGIFLEIFEGAGITWDGANATIRNNDRNSATVSTVDSLQADPTVVSLGTRIQVDIGGTATNPASGIPGVASRNRELILKKGTVYLFTITSQAASNIIGYCGQWYEPTPKD